MENNNYQQQNCTPMTVGDYMVTMLVAAIPLIGIIMLLVWAFGTDTNINKQNYCKALLLWAVIGIGLSIISSVLFGSVFAALASRLS